MCWRSRCPHADQILPKLPAFSYLSYIVAFTVMTCRNRELYPVYIYGEIIWELFCSGRHHTIFASFRATYIRNTSDEHCTNKSLNSEHKVRALFLAPDIVFELSRSINQSVALQLFCRNATCPLHGETDTALAKYILHETRLCNKWTDSDVVSRWQLCSSRLLCGGQCLIP